MDIQPYSGSLGAEIIGVTLGRNLTASELNQIRSALLEHEVLFFRDQNMTPEDHASFAAHFGKPQLHEAYPHVTDFPQLTILENDADNPSKIEMWHADMTFRPCPPLGSVLHAKVVPDRGGDTLFASMSAAYDALSPDMQVFLQTLTAVHDFSYGFKESLAEPGGTERLADMVQANPPVVHPVVRTHPESGKKSLFVNSLFTVAIRELTAKESRMLLDFLFEHLTTPEFTCRFRWQIHSVAFWDNRITQHKPVNDYWPQHRRLQRITVDDGERPV